VPPAEPAPAPSYAPIVARFGGPPRVWPGADPLSEALGALAEVANGADPRGAGGYEFRCFSLDVPTPLPSDLLLRRARATAHLASQLAIHIPVADPERLRLLAWAGDGALRELLSAWLFRAPGCPEPGRGEALSLVMGLLAGRLGAPLGVARVRCEGRDSAWGDEAAALVVLGQRAALLHLALWHD
jgi:hypothetical protein